MLKGNWKPHRQELLQKLDESSFTFHLTGSRFFGKFGIAADYDFFCENSEEIKTFLQNLEFLRLRESIYNGNQTDINTSIVFRKEGIDIQLVKNVEMKIELQERLLATGNCPPFQKIAQRNFWNNAYSKLLFEKELQRKSKGE